MKLVSTPSSVRYLGAAFGSVLVVGIGAGAAWADPATRTHDYFAQVAAGTRPDDRAGIRGVNAPAFKTAPAQQRSTAVRPDDRAGVRGIGASAVTASGVTVASASSFDWADAGVGAGSTIGLVLIAGGLVALRGRLRVPASHA